MKNAAGCHPGVVTPSTLDGALFIDPQSFIKQASLLRLNSQDVAIFFRPDPSAKKKN